MILFVLGFGNICCSIKTSRQLPGSLLPCLPFIIDKTSKKSSRRLPGSLPDDFQEVFQTTSRKSSDGVFFHIKWSLSLSL
ncbi:hypothetical protein Bca101_097745 [Brassica carinata]